MNTLLYNKLIELAKSKGLATYSEIAPMLGLSMESEDGREEIARLLGEIVHFEHEHHRPMLTSLIVHKGNDNNPGEGFFGIATDLKYYNGSRKEIERLTFWVNQIRLVHNFWSEC